MTRTVLIALFIITITVTAHARLAETPDQCEQRYGKHVTEIAGHGPVAFCRIYSKQGLNVAAIFIKGREAPKAACILYTTHQGGLYWMTKGKLAEEQRQSLLATVPGTWRLPRTAPAPTLQGGGRVKEMTVKQNSIGDSRTRTTRSAVKAATAAIYPRIAYRTPETIGQNSSTKYAFTIGGGMAITFYKVSEAIVAWSKVIQAQRAPQKEDPKELKGF